MNLLEKPELKPHLEAANHLLNTRISVPEGYERVNTQLVKHDSLVAFVFRYERSDGQCRGIGGEHFSVSIDMDATKVLGTMHVDQRHTGPGLPDHDTARSYASQHLETLAPDLVDEVELKWILPLREQPETPPRDSPFPMYDDAGKLHLITGIRVKFFIPQEKRWAWVIVGRDGSAISFERDVVWNSVLGRRSTEAWLHDEFVLEERERLRKLPVHLAMRSAS